MRVAYADPPYPGQSAKRYSDHPDFAGEVDHAELVRSLVEQYDGYCLHTASTTLKEVLSYLPDSEPFRIMSWRKPFCAFKRNVSVAYAWEPVIVKACRKPVVSGRVVMRDWISVETFDCSRNELDDLAESITLKRGLTGAKPEKVCHWLFEVLGMTPEDEMVDLFPGSGAVTRAWSTWREMVLQAA